jgi:hypothetical protein
MIVGIESEENLKGCFITAVNSYLIKWIKVDDFF